MTSAAQPSDRSTTNANDLRNLPLTLKGSAQTYAHVARLKDVGGQWDSKAKCWRLPLSAESLSVLNIIRLAEESHQSRSTVVSGFRKASEHPSVAVHSGISRDQLFRLYHDPSSQPIAPMNDPSRCRVQCFGRNDKFRIIEGTAAAVDAHVKSLVHATRHCQHTQGDLVRVSIFVEDWE